MIGSTLGHYKILDLLGAGGMGEVYRAEDTTLDREVALKVLPAELSSDPDRLARFEREAKTLAALDHPNIVTIHTVEEAEGVRFLTMQLVVGKPLSGFIPKGGMPLERIFDIAIPRADALATAHEKGVIHRDLKPANIMVTTEGRVKVLDFGLAKLLAPKGTDVGAPLAGAREGASPSPTETPTELLTAEGRILGTVPYMSPEQLEGNTLDARADVFSLGVILYEMATGERPFKGDSSVSLISSIMKDTPREVDSLRAEVPHHLARIIRHCLEKEPKRRYQSALDVRNELEDLHREETSQVAMPATTVSGPRVSREKRWWPVAAAGAAVVLVALLALWLRPSDTPSEMAAESPAEAAVGVGTQPPMIVVLPFENLGAPEDEYFADGMTEEITSRLAVVSGLRVISRTSAMQYKEERPALRQIGSELGVDYVLEGSVRWARADGGSRVRITPQLIRVADDSHLWADSYDRVIEDVFAIQSDIASRVIQQLGVTLQTRERQDLETRPTENLEAYQVYLRGKYLENIPDYSAEHREKVLDTYSQAAELDPDFALAHAALAHAHAFFYRLGYDLSETRNTTARAAVDRAMALEPESPRVLYEVGFYHYYIEQDYDAALGKFVAAAETNPNDGEILAATAYIWRRQGKWEAGLERLKEAFELSPRDAQIAYHIGQYSEWMRDYPHAVQYFDIAIGLAPDQITSYLKKAYTHLLWKGDLAESRRILEALPTRSEEEDWANQAWLDQHRLDRAFEEALDLLEAAPTEWFRLQTESHPIDLLRGEALGYLGEDERAVAAFDTARVAIEKQLKERPTDFRLHSALGLAYAGLGWKTEAVTEGKKAVELQPVSKDAYIGPKQLENLALIYTWLGEPNGAVDQLDILLSIPSTISVPWLRLDPRWDPLRDHPRFQALLDKYGQEGG